MKRFILSIIICVLIGSAALSAQNAPSQIFSNKNTFSFIPAYFSGDNRTTLFSYTYDSTTGECMYDIIDDDFSIKESFSISMPKAEFKLSIGKSSSFIQPSLYIHHAINTGMESAYYLCKNIFGNSGEYELLLPVLGSETVNIPFGGGFQVEMYTPVIGFEIVSQNGNTIKRVTFPAGYYGNSYNSLTVTPYIIDNHIFVTIPVIKTDGNTFLLVYDFGSPMASVDTNNVQPKLLHITPSMPNWGESITISYEDVSNSDKTFNIYSSSGQLVYTCNTKSNSISVPSSLLPIGVNIVYVSVNGTSHEASKIIIR